jgi:ParB family chromosome partitioning protein
VAELRNLSLGLINPPPIPIREAMNEEALAELAESMRTLGLLQPILVVPDGQRFEIEAGHRRYLAAQQLGWTTIQALVFDAGEIAREAVKLHENIFREDITAAEEAIFYAELLQKYNLDEDGLCRMVRQKPDYVADRLRLLRGDELVFDALRKRQIKFSVARELNKFADPALRRYYLDVCIKSQYPARQVTIWLEQAKRQNAIQTKPAETTAEPAVEPVGETNGYRCFMCGGDKDPWNLENVAIHRWEKDEILRLMRQAVERRD